MRKEPTVAEPVEGVPLILAGNEYLVPALSLAAFRRLGPRLAALESSGDRLAQMGVMGEALHAAMRRNYPELTLEQVEEMFDLRTIEAAFQAVLGQSGVVPHKPGEGTPLGESTGPS